MRPSPNTLESYMEFLQWAYPNPEFKPFVQWHNTPRGYLEVVWENESYYVERGGERFEYYKTHDDDNRIVGIRVYDLKGLKQQDSLLTRNDPYIVAEKEEKLKSWMEGN